MTVQITVELTEQEALAYAQFLKRVGFYDYKQNAVDDNETYQMVYAGEKIRAALAEEGYSPH